MKAREIKIDGYIITGDEREKVNLYISCPIYDYEGDDYYCSVQFSGFLSNETKIYGVDSEQARSLAIEFVKDLIDDSEMIDHDGNPIIVE